jgi:hypothetical protein
MKERFPAINGCKAVAAHGRRCVQTPFMTSPFCWHHTARTDRDALRHETMRSEDHAKVSIDRIVRILGDREVTEIAEFLESGDQGEIRIERRGDQIVARTERAAS